MIIVYFILDQGTAAGGWGARACYPLGSRAAAEVELADVRAGDSLWIVPGTLRPEDL